MRSSGMWNLRTCESWRLSGLVALGVLSWFRSLGIQLGHLHLSKWRRARYLLITYLLNYLLFYLLTYLLTHSLTHSMEHSPSWETNRFLASQEIPHILWDPKVHYHIHKCPSPVPILSQLDPVHTPTSYYLKIHLNIILPSMPGSPTWSLSLRFPHQNSLYTSLLPRMHYMPCPSHSSRFYHPNNIGWTVQIIKFLRYSMCRL